MTDGRRGCAILVAILAAVLILLALIGFNADPTNETEGDIPTAPAG